MKIKQFKSLKFNLFFIQFLKFKIYKVNKIKYKNIKYYFNQFILQKIYFKSVLNIIFYYYLANKRIIFLGHFFLYYSTNLLNFFKKTEFFFLPIFFYKNGFLTNKIAFFRYLKLNKNKNFILELLIEKPFDLIIILNKISQKFIFKDFFKFNIPIINIYLSFKRLFKIKYSNLFFLFLNSIFKKM